jgi:hypothetical protein
MVSGITLREMQAKSRSQKLHNKTISLKSHINQKPKESYNIDKGDIKLRILT